MSPDELQQTLRDLPKVGTVVKSHSYREVWRFEFGGKPYYLKFYPRDVGFLKRIVRGSDALRELTKGRPVIMIAHRLSTISEADHIVVLKDGVVSEEGSHGELLALGGVYAERLRIQYETPGALPANAA